MQNVEGHKRDESQRKDRKIVAQMEKTGARRTPGAQLSDAQKLLNVIITNKSSVDFNRVLTDYSQEGENE